MQPAGMQAWREEVSVCLSPLPRFQSFHKACHTTRPPVCRLGGLISSHAALAYQPLALRPSNSPAGPVLTLKPSGLPQTCPSPSISA